MSVFILYSKSGCHDCERAKELLKREKHILINCDQMIKNNRDEFMKSMEIKTHRPFKQFPLIFLGDNFIGGYNDLLLYLTFEIDENNF
jgi:glutaredoxin